MFAKLYDMMNWPIIEGIEYSDITNPHDILGPHMTDNGLLIQSFLPNAEKVQVKYSGGTIDMCKMDDDGFYAVLLDTKKVVDYKILVTNGKETTEFSDPYAFDIGVDYKELTKYNAGILYDAYNYLGSHKTTINNTTGVMFRVWAPEAIRISVIGDFNEWDGRIHQMTKIENTDIFEIFIPGLDEGTMYKYEIKKRDYVNIIKSDPFSFKIEEGDGDASIVASLDNYKWTDNLWIKNRSTFDINNSPISIYELNIGTFSKNKTGVLNYKDIANDVASYVKKMGYTHIEIMPIAEYSNDESFGYDTDFFYAPTNRYGSNEDLMAFVDIMHNNGIGVILDWVVNHYTKLEAGIIDFDGTCVYGHTNPRRGLNPKNGNLLFNYGRPEVTNFLIANSFMWVDKYHFDGLKIVNTASLLYLDYDKKPGQWEINILGGNEDLEAIEFMKHFNSIMHFTNKGIITIADDDSGYPELTGEVSESCIGFDLKTNTSWRKDLLEFMSYPAYLRPKHYNDISLSMIYQYSDNFIIGYPENDFVKGNPSLVSRMVGDNEDVKFSNTKLALAYSYVHPGKKVLFMGQDLAQYAEWLPNGYLDFDILNVEKHKNVNDMVKELNKLYNSEKSLYELDNSADGFEWINNISANECILTFVRKGAAPEDMLLIICNFEAVDRSDYKIGVPSNGKYKEIFSTANVNFGGNGFTNPRLKQAKLDECDGREYSVRVNVPALSVSIFRFTKVEEKVKTNKEAKEAIQAKKTATKKTTVKKAADTKATTKKAADTKSTAKKIADKKVEPKKIADKKVEPKKIADKKVEPKKIADKKVEPKKIADKKVEPKKIADKKVEPKKIADKKSTSTKETK